MRTDVLTLVADAYRSGGPLRQRVAARSFLALMSREDVERELGELLEQGALVPAGEGSVMLSHRVRASVLSRSVLLDWLADAERAQASIREVLLAGIRAELRDVARACAAAPESTGLPRRAVALVAVLAMSDLDPRAMQVVAGLPGTTRDQLEDLAEIPQGSLRTLKELQARVRHYISAVTMTSAVA